jgi:hypothetical protein
MSVETLKQVVARLVSEPEFRELLSSEPDQALEGYDLSAEEIAALKAIQGEAPDAAPAELAERISRAGFTLGLPGELDPDKARKITGMTKAGDVTL